MLKKKLFFKLNFWQILIIPNTNYQEFSGEYLKCKELESNYLFINFNNFYKNFKNLEYLLKAFFLKKNINCKENSSALFLFFISSSLNKNIDFPYLATSIIRQCGEYWISSFQHSSGFINYSNKFVKHWLGGVDKIFEGNLFPHSLPLVSFLLNPYSPYLAKQIQNLGSITAGLIGSNSVLVRPAHLDYCLPAWSDNYFSVIFFTNYFSSLIKDLKLVSFLNEAPLLKDRKKNFYIEESLNFQQYNLKFRKNFYVSKKV